MLVASNRSNHTPLIATYNVFSMMTEPKPGEINQYSYTMFHTGMKEYVYERGTVCILTFSRAREEMYTCSAVSTAGASVGGPCKKHTQLHFSPRESNLFSKTLLIYVASRFDI